MAAEPGPVTRALLDLARYGDSDHALAVRLCRACMSGVEVDGAAVSRLTATALRETLCTTDATAATLEDLQLTLGEGVCVDAATSGRPVLIPDIHHDLATARWPVFAASVAEQTDVRALFALPLQLGTINLGVLDLYREVPGPLRGPELRDVAAATDAATLLLLGAYMNVNGDGRGGDTRHDEVRGGHPGPGRWVDRAEVHQATGIILAQLDIPAQDAFVRLRAYAFAHRRPLAEVARDVVAQRLVFTEDME